MKYITKWKSFLCYHLQYSKIFYYIFFIFPKWLISCCKVFLSIFFSLFSCSSSYGFLSGSLDKGNKGENKDWWSDPDSKVHIGVGCDFCGVKVLFHHIFHFFCSFCCSVSIFFCFHCAFYILFTYCPIVGHRFLFKLQTYNYNLLICCTLPT